MTSASFQAISSGSRHVLKTSLAPAHRVTLSEIQGQWQPAVKQRLEELVRLEEGWDGYTAFPVSFDSAMFAFRMLESICRPDTAPPQIVPGSSGDLQIEWHTQRGDIELWVRGPNNVHACRSSNDEDFQEIDLTNDFSTVSKWVKEVTEPTIAYAAAP